MISRKGFIGTLVAGLFGMFVPYKETNGVELQSVVTEFEPMQLIHGEAIRLEPVTRIRLWTLGILTDNPATCVLPNKEIIVKLRSLLGEIKKGEDYDLVWGPELTCSTHCGNIDKIIVPVKMENGEVLYRIEKDGEINGQS